jgi:hypothetical protein
MIRTIIIAGISIAVIAAVAYHKGWLSPKGEKVYENAKEAILEKSGEVVNKGREMINKQ